MGSELVKVKFHGAPLDCLEQDGKAWGSIRCVRAALGVKEDAQKEKLEQFQDHHYPANPFPRHPRNPFLFLARRSW